MKRNLKLQIQLVKEGQTVKQNSLDIDIGLDATPERVLREIEKTLKASGIGEPNND